MDDFTIKELIIVRRFRNIGIHLKGFPQVEIVDWEPKSTQLIYNDNGENIEVVMGTNYKTSETFEMRCLNIPMVVVKLKLFK